ncbi:MAG: hypothetical protein KBF88_08600 [Polyangiaceae bacterium]|nr:hypothetical protein [Polyangiaceae bacterium]
MVNSKRLANVSGVLLFILPFTAIRCVPEVVYDGGTDGAVDGAPGGDAATNDVSLSDGNVTNTCPGVPNAPATACCGTRNCDGNCNAAACNECTRLCGEGSVCCAKSPQKIDCFPVGTQCVF